MHSQGRTGLECIVQQYVNRLDWLIRGRMEYDNRRAEQTYCAANFAEYS
jgi:hypothetical protein